MRETQTALTEPQKKLLLHLARANIGSEWHHELHNEIASIKEKLITIARPQACFVTLHLGSRLRGCIGTLEAVACLPDAVSHYARAAAFEDPRFPPPDAPGVGSSDYLHHTAWPLATDFSSKQRNRLIQTYSEERWTLPERY